MIYRVLNQIGLWLNALFAYVFLYVPILILIVYSFNASRFNATWGGFTLDWYRSLFTGLAQNKAMGTDVVIWNALRNSFLVASISTILATVLGTMLAIALERFRFKGRRAVEALVLAPIVIPEITMGISLLVFFSLIFQLLQNLIGVRLVLSLYTVIISHVAFSISFIVVIVRSRLAQLDPTLEEAAEDLGASQWQTFWRVTAPLISSAVLSAALLAFTLSLDNFVTTFFVTGVGATTLPVYVYGLIKFSVTPAINAISTLIVLISLTLVSASLLIQRRYN